MPNLPDIIEIGYSWKRLVVLLAGGIALTAGSAAMAFHLFPDMHVDAFYTAVGYFGVVFFGFAMLKIGWLLLTARGPVLFIDRNGIRDLRVSPTTIPWDAVEQIGIVPQLLENAEHDQHLDHRGRREAFVAVVAEGAAAIEPSRIDADDAGRICSGARDLRTQVGGKGGARQRAQRTQRTDETSSVHRAWRVRTRIRRVLARKRAG